MRVPLLTYENLCVSYGEQTVLQDVNLCVYEGETVGIVGESGSGKSTILRATMGLLGRAGRIQQVRYKAAKHSMRKDSRKSSQRYRD